MQKLPYKTHIPHNFFHTANKVVGKEVHPGNTITFINEIDLTELEEIRAKWKGALKPTYTAFIAKAAALTLIEFPYANRRIFQWPFFPSSKTRMQTFFDINIAIACERNEPEIEVATFMDVIKNVDTLNLSQITKWLLDLSNSDATNNKQWRDFFNLICRAPRWLTPMIISMPKYIPRLWSKWRGGALVISSPGKYGVDYMVGTWPAPIGISFGLAKTRPIVKNGHVVAAKTLFLTLNWDRRVMAGAQAARFFKSLCDRLENPESMKEWLK